MMHGKTALKKKKSGNEHSWALPGIFPILGAVGKFAHKLKCVLCTNILLYFGYSYLKTRATLNFVTNFNL